jgi:hypothetical protein
MIKAISPAAAAKILAKHGYTITVARLEMGLRQKVFPFGEAVEMKGGRYTYTVYSVLLDKWIAERSEPA